MSNFKRMRAMVAYKASEWLKDYATRTWPRPDDSKTQSYLMEQALDITNLTNATGAVVLLVPEVQRNGMQALFNCYQGSFGFTDEMLWHVLDIASQQAKHKHEANERAQGVRVDPPVLH